MPVQALFVLLWGNTWNLSFYVDYMPMLLYYVLDYDLMMVRYTICQLQNFYIDTFSIFQQASTLTSTSILVRTLLGWVCTPASKYLIQRYSLYTGLIRKLFTVFCK